MSNEVIRETTWHERATWGKCPVCGVEQDAWCIRQQDDWMNLPDAGLVLNDSSLYAHIVRFKRAPRRVKMVPA